MSVFLRSLLVLSVSSLLVVGCGEKEAAPVETAPAPVAVTVAPLEAAPAAESTAGGGGYEPTAEERVPGITLDAAAVDAATTSATATDTAPAVLAPAAK
jgi:hypothetical protein